MEVGAFARVFESVFSIFLKKLPDSAMVRQLCVKQVRQTYILFQHLRRALLLQV